MELDPQGLADELQPSAESLRGALEDVELKSAELRATQEAKHKAIAAFDADYATAVRLFGAVADLTGDRKLADQLRRERRRK